MCHHESYKSLPLFLGGKKDLRSLYLKVISIVLNKYDSINYGTNLWDMFFTTIKSLDKKFTHESGSRKTPSSLFTCFLEMNNHLKLASFLKRDKSLVPNIPTIMFVKSVLEAMISTILTFVENLLNMEHMKIKIIFCCMHFFYCILICLLQVCKTCFTFVGKIRGRALQNLGNVS